MSNETFKGRSSKYMDKVKQFFVDQVFTNDIKCTCYLMHQIIRSYTFFFLERMDARENQCRDQLNVMVLHSSNTGSVQWYEDWLCTGSPSGPGKWNKTTHTHT